MNFTFSSLIAIVPMCCVTATAIAAMIAEAFREPGERMPIGPLGVIGLVGAAVASVALWNSNAASFGVVAADNFGLFVTWILIIIGLLSLAFSAPAIQREQLPRGEYYALLLFAIAGMMLMATATDLLVIFLALEVLSLAVYVLTGIRRLDRIGGLMAAQSISPTPLQLLAVGLVLVGFAFKVSAVPFHMWTPDAYQGAPTIVTGFMSTAVKAAAFAAFVRVFLTAFGPLSAQWAPLLGASAIATMIVGTVVGVAQTSV